jgi:flagellar assembly factor FliW
MVVETARFGRVEVDEKAVIRIPRGLIGFEQATEFCLLDHCPACSFRWLQCTATPSLSFVVIDPSAFFPDYAVDVSETEARYLGLDGASAPLVLALVTIDRQAAAATANLAAPIVVNPRTLVGMQIVLDAENYTTKHELVHPVDAGAGEQFVRAA